jgi:hypothetical protein
MISPMLTQTMGRKLWLVSGGAFAVAVAIDLLGVFLPSFQRHTPLALIIVSGIWAALGLLVLLAEARRLHQLVVLIVLALAVTLSFSTHWFGIPAFLLGYFGAYLFVGTVLVFGILRLFRKKPRLRVLLLALTMITMGAWGVLLSAWSARPAPPLPQQAMSISDELQYIYDTDQSDRRTGYMWIDLERDRMRLQRGLSLAWPRKVSQEGPLPSDSGR